MENTYRIEEYSTMGWTLIDHDAVKMPRPIAEQRLNRYIELGHNPEYLRVVVDNDLSAQ